MTSRDKLIDSARQLFWEQGYTATGVAQILKESGVNSGSLYHYFPTKEDLLLAVLDWYRNNLLTMVIDPVRSRVSDPIEQVFGVLDGYRIQLVATEFTRGCPVGNLALELATTHPIPRDLIRENFEGWQAAIQEMLGRASGRFPEGTDTAELSIFVLTTMEGAVMLARAYRSIDPYLSAVNRLRDYFDRLLDDGGNWSAPRNSPVEEP